MVKVISKDGTHEDMREIVSLDGAKPGSKKFVSKLATLRLQVKALNEASGNVELTDSEKPRNIHADRISVDERNGTAFVCRSQDARDTLPKSSKGAKSEPLTVEALGFGS